MWLTRWLRGLRHSESAGAPPSLAQLKAATPGLHRLFPQNGVYLAALASSLFARGHAAQAMQALEEARARGYNPAGGAALLARHQVTTGQFRQALDTLEPVLAQAEPPADAFEIAGAAHFNLKDIPEAYRHYREAVQRDPGNALVRGSFAGVLDHYARFEEAIVEAKRALR